jgi:hypothetical protein
VRPKAFAPLHALHFTSWKEHVTIIILVVYCLRGIIIVLYSENVWFPILVYRVEVFISVIVVLSALSQMPVFVYY